MLRLLILLLLIGCESKPVKVCTVHDMFNGDKYPNYRCYENGEEINPDNLEPLYDDVKQQKGN